MIYLLKNNLDYEKALKSTLNQRFPFFIYFDKSTTLENPGRFAPFQCALDQPRPRLIQTHLPIQMLPDQIWTVNPCLVYVYRQPKDVVVSYFHHSKLFHNYLGGIKEYVDCFVKGYLQWSPYHSHISGFLELREVRDNILVTRYEDMIEDLPKQIRRAAKFLNLQFEDWQILELADHLSIDSMKSIEFNEQHNKFTIM